MKFIDDHGADLNSADVPTHMFKRVRFEANEQVDVCRLAQPDAGWEQLGGNWTLGGGGGDSEGSISSSGVGSAGGCGSLGVCGGLWVSSG